MGASTIFVLRVYMTLGCDRMENKDLEAELRESYKKYIAERKKFIQSLSPRQSFKHTVDSELMEEVGMFREAAIVDGIHAWLLVFEEVIEDIRGAIEDAEKDFDEEDRKPI